MCSLELTYKTLKDIILQRTKQQSQLDPSLLERWNPSETVLRYSPWTCMRLMLNLVAEDNITDLFPNDWQPVSPQSTTQQKHFQILTEVMTELFLHCGLVNDEWVIEVANYQDFLKVLLHHLVMGNISTTQVTQFAISMVYMSICRLKHYSDAMEDRHAMMLKSSIWMTLVIMAFRTTFTMMGGTKIINTYYRNIPATVRRHLHVAVIRYMEQDCVCPNHVQCGIVPFSLTSEVVLPSYQHYLEREHHLKGTKVNKEDQDVTGAAASSEVPADETAKKSEPGDNTSIYSREDKVAEKKEKKSQKKSPDSDEEDMESQNSDDTDEQMDTSVSRRTNYI